MNPWLIGTHLIVVIEDELSNKYLHGRVWMAYKHFSGLISCIKVAATLKGLKKIVNGKQWN